MSTEMEIAKQWEGDRKIINAFRDVIELIDSVGGTVQGVLEHLYNLADINNDKKEKAIIAKLLRALFQTGKGVAF